MPRRLEAVEGGSRVGARGFQDWLASVDTAIEWEARLEEVRRIDDQRVLAITPTMIKGKSSEISLGEQRLASLVTVIDGKVTHTEVFGSEDEALEAAGRAE